MPQHEVLHQSPEVGHHGDDAHHIVPPSTYLQVFIKLMVLLVITLAAAAFDLGPLNLPIAMAIACAKVALIMSVFMHLKYNSPLVRFFALASIFWLVLLFFFTLSDYVSRGWLVSW